MSRNQNRMGWKAALVGAAAPWYRRLACEWLEDRRMLNVGDLLQTLTHPSVGYESYGCSVAASGSTLVVGAFSGTDESDGGSAYIFDAVTGNLLHTLKDPTSAIEEDAFGFSVSVSGNTVVVGAPNDDTGATGAGAAYIFDAVTGNLLHRLYNPTPAAGFESFGYSVSVSGSTVVVGAPFDNSVATDAGSVYIFDAVTGNLLQTLRSPTLSFGEWFGWSVSVSGNRVVVGAPNDDTGATGAGAAYIFDADTGNLLHTLNDPTPPGGHYFGWSASVSGNRVVVGACSDHFMSTDPGSAYVFDAATGSLLHTLNNPTPTLGDYFGWSVSVSGSTVVVGASRDSAGATECGSAYIFNADTGSLLWTLNNPTPQAHDYFGGAVSMSGSRVMVGADGDSTVAWRSGAAYLFDSTPGNTSVSLVGDDLLILDDAAGGKDDGLSISLDTLPNPDEVVIHDPNAILGANNIPFYAVIGEGTDTLRVEVSAFGGKVIVATGSGDDTLTVDFSRVGGSPLSRTAGLVYQGGGNGRTGDRLQVTGASVRSAVYRPDGTPYGSGSLEVVLANTHEYITFTGVEPIDVSGMEAVSLETPYGADWVMLQADSIIPTDRVCTLNDPTPAAYGYFGGAMSMSGNVLVVGAYADNAGAAGAGSAYVFDAAAGTLLHTLNNPTPATNDHFGKSVAVSGSTIVVGAPLDDTGAAGAGAAYVFDAATGTLLHTLNNPTPATDDYFGMSVAVSGSTVVVGALVDDTGATDAGSAYIYDAATGNLLRTLNNPTPAVYDHFGYSVAVSGSMVVVTAPYDDTGATDAGSAYIYDAATGNLLRTLSNPTPATGDYFGWSASVSGSRVAVGAPLDDTGVTGAGSAYIFDAATGNLLHTLNDPSPADNDLFGYSVAVSDSTAVVGATYNDTGAINAGSAFIFDADTGNLLCTLSDPSPADSDFFGFSASVSGSTVVVAAPYDDTGATDAGSAYIFDAGRVDATTITGTSSSVYFGPLTVYDVRQLVLDLDADPSFDDDDGVYFSGSHLARGLQALELRLGTGPNDVAIFGSVDLGADGQFRALGEEVTLAVFGGSITAERVTLPAGGRLRGGGTVAAALAGVDHIEALWNLNLGTGGLRGFEFAGTLVAGASTVTLSTANFARLGALTTIEGGVLAAPRGVALPTGSTLHGRGSVAGRIAAQAGSTIFATSTLILGDANSYSGFFSDGELYVGPYLVVIDDRDQAVLGSLTEIGDSSDPGTLWALNGLLVDFGCTVVGHGMVMTPPDVMSALMVNGSIRGDSTTEPITLTGYIKGVGTLEDVVITGTYSPGFSPAVVQNGSIVYDSAAVVVLELSGTTPGSNGHDQINHTGTAMLGGQLVVQLIGGFVPAAGETFVLMTATEALTGVFTDVVLPTPPAGTEWELVADRHTLRLTLLAVPVADVVGRHVFYNRSAWDGNDAAANAADDQAIASDKIALLPDQKATLANYTSYSRGINGIMIDIADLAEPASLSVADFEFRTGNTNNPGGWSLLVLDPGLISVAVRPGEGTDGSDRVTILLPDGAVKKTWLQVTVKATAATGLAAPDVHYWGNAVGDSGNSASDTAVNVVDALGVRANPHTLLKPAPIDDAYDYNRDKQVNVQDELIVRGNPTTLLTDLNLIDLRGYGGDGEGEGEWSGDAWVAWADGGLLDTTAPLADSAPPTVLVVPSATSSDLLRLPALTSVVRLTRSAATTSRWTPSPVEDLVPHDPTDGRFTLPVAPSAQIVSDTVDMSDTSATSLLGGDDPFAPRLASSPEARRMDERLAGRSNPQGSTSTMAWSQSAIDDYGPVGPVKEDQSQNLTRRIHWAQDPHGRNQQRTLDEALLELLAEWEQS